MIDAAEALQRALEQQQALRFARKSHIERKLRQQKAFAVGRIAQQTSPALCESFAPIALAESKRARRDDMQPQEIKHE